MINNNRMRARTRCRAGRCSAALARPPVRAEAVDDLAERRRRRQAAADREGLCGRDRAGHQGRARRLRFALLMGSADKAKRLDAATALADSRHARHQAAADRAPEGRDRCRGASAALRVGARADRRPPRLGRAPGRGLHRHQPGLDPAAGGAGPGHHLRADGRHQHGARRADDDRRLRHLRGAEPVPQPTCRAPSTTTCWPPSRRPSWPRRWSARCSSAASSAGSTAGRWRRCWPPGASA